MIGDQPTDTIPSVHIQAVSHEGLTVTVNGRPGRLAIVTDDGEIIVTHEVPFPSFLEELRDGRRTFHGFQGGVMWLLHGFARKTRDRRLAALLD